MKQIYLLFLFLTSLQLYAQEGRIRISGEIKSDSIPIENAHIINLNSEKGTVSDDLGLFEIAVKENDTLLFSDIQFENILVLIRAHHLENKYIKVNFQLNINELDEVIIQDSNMASSLGLPNADVIPMTETERKVNYYKKGGSISKLYGLISGEQKTRRKIQRLEEADEKNITVQRDILRIRNHFKDDFFIYTLKIPEESINNFISSCVKDKIIPLFKGDRYLEMINVFLAKSKTFEK